MPRLSKRTKNKIKKFAFKNAFLVTLLIVILVGVMVFGYFQGWFDKYLKKEEYLSTAGGYVTDVTTLKDLKISFLDVGQGDCIIIELPDGKNMIIDSGQFEKAQNAIADFTANNKITTFDYLLLTHADRDHVDKMSWVIDTYDIKYIFRPNNHSDNSISKDLPIDFNTKTEGEKSIDTQAYAKFMTSAYNEKCPVEVFNKDSDFTNTIKYNDNDITYTFDFLTPIADRDKIVYSNKNNYSPILILNYMNTKIMFTGDAEEKMLEEYVSTYGNANNVDVLKVGHHGSQNATTIDFLQAIDPEYAVIQCGKGNTYGHPEAETLNRLIDYDSNMKIYRNDTNGLITLRVNSSGLDFTLEKSDCSNNLVAGVKPEKKQVNFSDYLSHKQLLVA